MGFNYQREKLKWWKKEKVDIQIMKSAGMSESDIEELVRHDYHEFLAERQFQSHNLSLDLIQNQSGIIGARLYGRLINMLLIDTTCHIPVVLIPNN